MGPICEINAVSQAASGIPDTQKQEPRMYDPGLLCFCELRVCLVRVWIVEDPTCRKASVTLLVRVPVGRFCCVVRVVLQPSHRIEVGVLLDLIALKDADLIERAVFGWTGDNLAELPPGTGIRRIGAEDMKPAESRHTAFYARPFSTAVRRSMGWTLCTTTHKLSIPTPSVILMSFPPYETAYAGA